MSGLTAGRAMVLVALLASLNYLVGIGEPRHTVWDETYYLTSTQRFEDGNAQFASHPPLGLLLIAAGDAVLGPNRGLDTSPLHRAKKISGEQLPENFSFVGVRLASGLFAVGGAVVFCALMLILTRSVIGAALLSNLYVFENAFIVQFRAAQLDAFQVFFSLCALLCWAVAVRRGTRGSLGLDFLLGLFCGLAAMVKLNAAVLALLGVVLIGWRIRLGWQAQRRTALLAGAARDGAIMAVGGLVAILAVMTIDVAVSRQPPDAISIAGKQDDAFVSATYRSYLEHKRPLSPVVVLAATRDYARFISSDFAGMARSDTNASSPLLWPLHQKTINYRWDSRDGVTSYVQMCGNLFGWVLAFIAPLLAVALLLLHWMRPLATLQSAGRSDAGWRRDDRALLAMLTVQYFVFLGVHAWLGTQRVMYVYHYFIGLVLAFCLLPVAWAAAAARWQVLRTRVEPVLTGVTVLLLASFLFYSPLTFHRPLTHDQCERRNVFQHVVDCRS